MGSRSKVESAEGSFPIVFLGKCLVISYLFTVGLLLLLAFLLYRFELSAEICSVGIIVVYIVVNLLSGFLAGRRIGNRKFLWGLMIGGAYFLLLAVVSLCVNHSVSAAAGDFLTTLLLCAGSGMLGGMLS